MRCRSFNPGSIGASPARSRAFTLVELMVVMTVVLILASLLVGAMRNAQSGANQISCMNRLRQLQMAWMLYVDEHNDQLPLNRTASPGKNSPGSWVVGNPKEDRDTLGLEMGTLFPYHNSAAIYRCPADASFVTGTKILRTRSYSISRYMNGDGAGLEPKIKKTHPAIISPGPASIFVFIEEHEDSLWAGSFDVAPRGGFALSSTTGWSSTPSSRHNQGANITFADGHNEYWRWLQPKPSNLQSLSTLNGNQQKDLLRLQQSIPD